MLHQKSLLRTSALLILLAMAAAAASSCGEAGSGTETSVVDTAVQTEAETEDPNSRANIKDSLPDDLDFTGRTFSIFCSNGTTNDSYIGGPAEQTGEVVDDAVLARNKAVEERLGVTLRSDTIEYGWDTVSTGVSKLIMAGDTTYDLFFGQQAGITKLVTDNCFVNAFDLKYLDFTQPWWNNEYMEALSLGKDYRFFLISDYDISTLDNLRVVYYNKAMYARYYDDGDGLYQEVFDGKWTLDRMAELSKSVFIDLDNNGKSEMTDQLGYVTWATGSSVDAFVYATDISFTERDADGFITLNLMQDRAVTLLEKLNTIFWQEGSCHQTDGKNTDCFIAGTALFLGNATLGTAKNLRDMKEDFGFLPYPKLDEAQEGYHSLVHDTVLVPGISNASQNLDIAGAVLEALSAETYRSVTPVWYETALKVKYSRDMASTQMIDLIHDSMTTNFAFAYNYSLNNAGLMFRELVGAKSTNYASKCKSVEKSATKQLAKLVEAFTGANE